MSVQGSVALASYRAEIAQLGQLAPDEERDLAVRYQGGDRSAARPLIEGCLPCVVRIALEYRRCGLPIEDLVQEGNLGLLRAVDQFDPARGVRLATYAAYWIRAHIRDYVARHYRIVRLGGSKGELRALWLYRKTLEQRPEALAEMSGLTTERAAALLPVLAARDVSFSAAPDEDGPSLAERLPDRTASIEELVGDVEERARLHDALERAMAELPARDQDIARRRLLAEEPATLEQLGATWGVTRERVRQLEERVKLRLRDRLAEIAADVVPALPAGLKARTSRARGQAWTRSRPSRGPATRRAPVAPDRGT